MKTANANNSANDNSVFNKKNEKIVSNCWAHFQSWFNDNTRGNENDAMVGKAKAVELCKKYAKCEQFGAWSKKTCKNCTGVLFDICSFVSAEELAKKAAEEKVSKKGKKSSTVQRNYWTHKAGSQAEAIDNMVVRGCFSKEEIAAMCGCSMARLNSHLYHLSKEIGVKIVVVSGVVRRGK